MSTGDLLTKILLAIIAAGFVGDLTKGFFQKKKVNSSANLDDASAIQVIVSSANALLTPLTNRLAEAENEAVTLRRELQQARQEIHRTMNELIEVREENQRVTAENQQLRNRLAKGTA